MEPITIPTEISLSERTDSPDLTTEYTALVPPGHVLHVFKPETMLDYVVQQFQADSIQSLTGYLNRYVTCPDQLLITVDHAKRCFTAILDAASSAECPSTNTHKASLQLVYSRDFTPLAAILDKPIAQDDFLNFLDQHGFLFLEAATLEQLVANFRQTTVVKFASVKNRDTGNYKLAVEAENSAPEEWKIPSEVRVVLAIFEGQEPQTLTLKLRALPKANTVTFTLVLPGFSKIVRDAVNGVRSTLLQWLDAKAEESRAIASSDKADWSKATMLEGSVTTTPNTPAEWRECKGLALPAPIVAAVPTNR